MYSCLNSFFILALYYSSGKAGSLSPTLNPTTVRWITSRGKPKKKHSDLGVWTLLMNFETLSDGTSSFTSLQLCDSNQQNGK